MLTIIFIVFNSDVINTNRWWDNVFSYSVQFYNCLQFREHVDADRVAIQLSPDHSNGNTHIQQFKNCSVNPDTDVYDFVDSVDNTKIPITVKTLSKWITILSSQVVIFTIH